MEEHAPADQRLVLSGDFNIAPDDRDVYDPKKFVGATHVSRPEREALRELLAGAWSTASASSTRMPKLYTWWDYRAGDFHSGRGLRIDLMLVTEPLAKHITCGLVDRNARKGKQASASDHAPVFLDIDVEG